MQRPTRYFIAQPIQRPGPERCGDVDDLPARFAIHCASQLVQAIIQYSAQFRNTEIFGLLLGRVIITPGERLRTVIEDYVPAQVFAHSDIGFVEVSASELMRLDAEVEERTEGSATRIVGWFHTHPGHGVFMSATDRDNHRLYTQSWQVALVVDPHSRQWGFFNGPNCEPVPQAQVVQNGPALPPPEAGSGQNPGSTPNQRGLATMTAADADSPPAPAPAAKDESRTDSHEASTPLPAASANPASNSEASANGDALARARPRLFGRFSRSWRLAAACGTLVAAFTAIGAELWMIRAQVVAQKKQFDNFRNEQLKELALLKQQLKDIAKPCGSR
jgi:proteasome lid subunit RPN8/RPN11